MAYLDHCARLSGAQLAMARVLDALGDRVDGCVILAEDGPLVGLLEKGGHTTHVFAMADDARALPGARVGAAMGPRPIIGTARYAMALAQWLRRARPDLVHTNSLKAAFYGAMAARLAQVPVVVHVRDRIAADFLPPRACRIVRLATRVLPSAVLGNETTLPTLGRIRKPAFEIVDPVDRRCFEVTPRARQAAPLRVGMVGRFAPWKGQHVFLEAFARAFPTGSVTAALIGAPLFGEEDYERDLRALAVRLGIAARVDFRGFREDIPSELARLDIAVHASVIPEPFGQVVTEAMAAGLPVVAADAGGPSRIISHDVDGLLSPPGDVVALSRHLRRLERDGFLRARLGAAARERARAFSTDVAAAQTLQAYERVVDGSTRAPFLSAKFDWNDRFDQNKWYSRIPWASPETAAARGDGAHQRSGSGAGASSPSSAGSVP